MKVQPFKIFILCLSCCATAFSFAELRVYTGTIAAQPVIVELSFDDNHAIAAGRYAYVKQGKVIPLERVSESVGKLAEQAWVAERSEQVDTAIWQLNFQDEKLVGDWQNVQGNTASIQLQPVNSLNNLPSIHHESSRTGEIFNVLLAQQSPALQLKRRSGKPQAGIPMSTLSWQQGNLKISGVQIAKPEQAGDLAINHYLKQGLQNEIGLALDCFANAFAFQEYQYKEKIHYINPDFVTLAARTEFNCNAMNIYSNRLFFSLGRQTGKMLKMNEIYQFQAENEFKFHQLIQKAIHKELKANPECLEENLNSKASEAIALDQQGVLVQVGDHYLSALSCNRLLLIPYAALRPFKRANAPINPERFK